jgi:hypothetical protein
VERSRFLAVTPLVRGTYAADPRSTAAVELATYLNSLRLAQRKERLDRIDRQLKELYGPILALVSASRAAYEGFRSICRPGVRFFADSPGPTDQELAYWRLWMKEVFMPYFEVMAKLITDHADLLDEDEIPDCFLELCAHVAANKAVIKAWDAGDFSRHTAVNYFPEKSLDPYVRTRFTELKKAQAALHGTGRWLI